MTTTHTDSADELARAPDEDELDLIVAVLKGYPDSMARRDALQAAERVKLGIKYRDKMLTRTAAYRTRPEPKPAGEADMAVYDAIAANYTAPAPAQRMSEEQERAAFEAWCKVNRPDLDLRFEYDAQGNYHWHGYIWDETDQALRLWQAGAAWGVKLKD